MDTEQRKLLLQITNEEVEVLCEDTFLCTNSSSNGAYTDIDIFKGNKVEYSHNNVRYTKTGRFIVIANGDSKTIEDVIEIQSLCSLLNKMRTKVEFDTWQGFYIINGLVYGLLTMENMAYKIVIFSDKLDFIETNYARIIQVRKDKKNYYVYKYDHFAHDINDYKRRMVCIDKASGKIKTSIKCIIYNSCRSIVDIGIRLKSQRLDF